MSNIDDVEWRHKIAMMERKKLMDKYEKEEAKKKAAAEAKARKEAKAKEKKAAEKKAQKEAKAKEKKAKKEVKEIDWKEIHRILDDITNDLEEWEKKEEAKNQKKEKEDVKEKEIDWDEIKRKLDYTWGDLAADLAGFLGPISVGYGISLGFTKAGLIFGIGGAVATGVSIYHHHKRNVEKGDALAKLQERREQLLTNQILDAAYENSLNYTNKRLTEQLKEDIETFVRQEVTREVETQRRKRFDTNRAELTPEEIKIRNEDRKTIQGFIDRKRSIEQETSEEPINTNLPSNDNTDWIEDRQDVKIEQKEQVEAEQRRKEEERKKREEQEQRKKEEERKKREEEEQRKKEEERKKREEEEQRKKEEEEQRRKDEERDKMLIEKGRKIQEERKREKERKKREKEEQRRKEKELKKREEEEQRRKEKERDKMFEEKYRKIQEEKRREKEEQRRKEAAPSELPQTEATTNNSTEVKQEQTSAPVGAPTIDPKTINKWLKYGLPAAIGIGGFAAGYAAINHYRRRRQQAAEKAKKVAVEKPAYVEPVAVEKPAYVEPVSVEASAPFIPVAPLPQRYRRRRVQGVRKRPLRKRPVRRRSRKYKSLNN